jgi:uncharacterized RDD family membrane protein YckC
MNYAGFWIRFCAYFIDYIISLATALLLLVVVGAPFLLRGGDIEEPLLSALSYIIMLPSMWLYSAFFVSGPWQATPGKRILGLRVTDLEGHRISFGRASGRYFSYFLSSICLGIGFIVVGMRANKQGFHDSIAGTLVLHGKPGLADARSLPINHPKRFPEDTVRDPIYSARDSSSWVMAGFDTNGNVVRVKFEQDDPKLYQSGLAIGRDAQACDVHISDPSISRRHARLFKKNGEIWLEDLSSTNGTLVNGVVVPKGGSVVLPGQGNVIFGGVELSIGRY